MSTRNYRWLRSLSNTLHKTQQKALLAMVAAVCLTGKIRSFSIAQTIARINGVKCKSALQRFYRFVNESKMDVLEVWRELTRVVLASVGRTAVVSIDWTEWRFDLRTLVATVSVARRAIPILAQTFTRSPPRSQNARENTFVRLLASFSPSGPEGGPGVRPGVPPSQPDPAFA